MLDTIFKSILTGQMRSFPLLPIAVAIFVYFLPSMLAFLKRGIAALPLFWR